MSEAPKTPADPNAPMTRPIPAPVTNVETQPFWDAAKEGRFLIKRCEECHRAFWYPRAMCPYCFSDHTVWEESPGEGVIYTYSVMHRSPTGLSIGMKVKVQFQDTEGGPPVPVFAPA